MTRIRGATVITEGPNGEQWRGTCGASWTSALGELPARGRHTPFLLYLMAEARHFCSKLSTDSRAYWRLRHDQRVPEVADRKE